MRKPLYVGPPVCPYCQLDSELIDSDLIYKKSWGMVWICQPCQAWVGVLQGSKSNRPKGTLAKAELRQLRVEAHGAFDPFWKLQWEVAGKTKSKFRKHYYNELADGLGLEHDACHIAMFNEDQCREVLDICARWKREAAEAASLLPDALE